MSTSLAESDLFSLKINVALQMEAIESVNTQSPGTLSISDINWHGFSKAEIGNGRFSSVYLVETVTGKRIALKSFRIDGPEDRKAFRRERKIFCEILRENAHRNVVECLGSIVDFPSQDYFICLEYVDGGTLRDSIGDVRAVPELFNRFCSDMIAALAHLEVNRVVHNGIRDAWCHP